MQQGGCCGDVLAGSGKVRKGPIVGEDPLVYVTGGGACVPTVSMTLDFLIDLSVLPNKLLFGVIDLQLLCSQLLHPYVRWGHRLSSSPGVRVACQGSLPSEMLSTCPSKVSAMKHSREG